ncbi:MAG: hypothetical protein HGB37_00745 [Candidatus Moranbacteria bacterium]|nr:hypothetical protein [Candidatus Moranbacteria bacterium]
MGTIEQLFTAIGKMLDAIFGIFKGQEVHEPPVPVSKEKERSGPVRFKNEPFMANYDKFGAEPVRLTPIVYDEDYNCGVGIVGPDGSGSVWGLVAPRDLVASWRATEILRKLSIIEHGTLCASYYAGRRNPHESDRKRYVEPIIGIIGSETYDSIMAMPVPEQIIRAILDYQDAEFSPSLYPITEEIKAGTIKWRQEFADAGINHPDDVEIEEERKAGVIARYEQLLCDYAERRKLPRECLGMNHVEGALLTLLDKGFKESSSHSDRTLVALSGIVGEIASFEFSMFMLPFGPPEDYHETKKKEAIEFSANWLSEDGEMRREDAECFLVLLLDEYFPTEEIAG